MVRQWQRMPRGIVQSLFLGVFNLDQVMPWAAWFGIRADPAMSRRLDQRPSEVPPSLNHPVTLFVPSSQVTWNLLFAFSEFWSQLNSGIKSSMVRTSCGVVPSMSALRSEHYDEEHDAGGDSIKPPMQSSLFSQATSWQAIPLFFSLEEMRQAN